MKHAIGSTPSRADDPRPRAQVSYEGEDEFSAMSLDPRRKDVSKDVARLQPTSPGAKPEVKIDQLKTTNDGFFSTLRRIFAK
jgi:hypothetical protein